SVFEREDCRSVLNFRQWSLRTTSFFTRFGRRQRAKVIDRPIREHRAAVNVLAGDRPKHTRIVGTDAVIPHHEIAAIGDLGRSVVRNVRKAWGNVGFGDHLPVNVNHAAANLDGFSRKGDDPLDKRLGAVQRIPEHHHVATLDGFKAVDKFVDEDAFLIRQQRRHAGAFHFYWLGQKKEEEQSEADGDEQVAGPNADFIAKLVRMCGDLWRNGRRALGKVGCRFGTFRSREGSARFLVGFHYLLPFI